MTKTTILCAPSSRSFPSLVFSPIRGAEDELSCTVRKKIHK